MKFYVVDLTKTKGNGSFKCPKCGAKISPDDETEEQFTILKPVMKKNGLTKVVLQCNKCESAIHLVGFQLLAKNS